MASPVTVITVASPKGGTGKTTAAVNLAAALAARGRRVLLVDLDPDGSASISLGPLAEGPTVADAVFSAGRVRLAETVRDTPVRGLKLAPADGRLRACEDLLRRDPEAVRRILVGAGADFVVIDTPPAGGPLSVAGIVAAELVLVPVALAALDAARLPAALGLVAELRDRYRPDLDALLLPNRTAPTRQARELLADLRERYGSAVTRAEIPQTVRLVEAVAAGRPIIETDPHGTAAEAFRTLAGEILRKVGA